MIKSLVLACLLLVSGICSQGQRVGSSPEYVKALTSEWKGERLPDGRPKVSDAIFARLKKLSMEEAWGVLRNTAGYLCYWTSRMLRMPENDCRTVALEVGLQNAGLGSGLALAMGKLSTVGLAPVVFAPIINITGSSLALWWRSRTRSD